MNRYIDYDVHALAPQPLKWHTQLYLTMWQPCSFESNWKFEKFHLTFFNSTEFNPDFSSCNLLTHFSPGRLNFAKSMKQVSNKFTKIYCNTNEN